ncbi:LCP family protein [Bacillus sp. FJAT-49732]|uniref:Polyisoprenyl-teichoic acid--peptidoglycan teichoic acid transferase TagU n=1 Tax=Lederbergia citrisecunda TaxID=2833583 RepID=A0A942TLU0_9BACI|nr:LCP family protein [Lederbergia citrisecunda]MBS4198352.1 LCP family protein [Lederbergia citrisecunda]
MERQVHKKNKKGFKILLVTLLVLISGIVTYGYSIYKNVNKAANTVHSPIDRTPTVKRESDLSLLKRDPFSVLVLGIDEEAGDKGRSDSMIMITVNPEKKSMEMLSIPRDTRTEIVGKGFDDKINHAYAFGGVKMSMNTVEKFLDIPIDYYVKLNMQGFKDIVEAIGGVTVNNDLDFSVGKNHFPVGQISLNGKEALDFVRMRKQDPRGDFGRQMRQRLVIQDVMNKAANISTLWKYTGILEALTNNVETNISFDEMKDMQKYYGDVPQNVEQIQMEGTGEIIDNIWYFIVSEEEQSKIQTQLKEHMKIM